MSNKQFQNFDAVTTVLSDDLLLVVNNALVTPVTKKITLDNLAKSMSTNGGWVRQNPTETITSEAYTITIYNDYTSIYKRGLKIKLTQDATVKYFYVVNSTVTDGATVINVTNGAVNPLSTNAITEFYYSMEVNPVGFPSVFNYTPLWGATVTPPYLSNGTLLGKFAIRGNLVFCTIYLKPGSGTTYGSGTWAFTLPVLASNDSNDFWLGLCNIRKSTTNTYNRMIKITGGSGNISTFYDFVDGSNVTTLDSTHPATWDSTFTMSMQIEYEMF